MSPITEHPATARTLTRLSGCVDPWFLGRYGFNLYRGCEHGCLYCDGRAERYYVAGAFDRDIHVKTNAVELLRAELARRREPGFVFVGGGVSDAYQPAEARHQLARGALEVCLELGLPVHVLTKSELVERDLDLLVAIETKARAILSFSISSDEERHRERFEPRASPLAARWRLLATAKRLGLATGVMMMPLLPGLSDTPSSIGALVQRARDAGVDFVLAGGLTLRPGVQKQTFLDALRGERDDLLSGYGRLYRSSSRSGAPDSRYLARVDGRCRAALAEAGLPGRVPWRLFRGLLPSYAEVAVLLEHRGWADGQTMGPMARAAWAIQQWARERLGRARGPEAYRAVEDDFARLVVERRLSSAVPAAASIQPSILEELHQQVASTRAARAQMSLFPGR